jgi:hypothetical protein
MPLAANANGTRSSGTRAVVDRPDAPAAVPVVMAIGPPADRTVAGAWSVGHARCAEPPSPALTPATMASADGP